MKGDPHSVGVSDKLDEFRMSAKKVELPSFDREDPIAWITRAETYFEVPLMKFESS